MVEEHPVLCLEFPAEEAFSATGITFRFWPSTEEWCSEIYVTWYYNDEVVGATTAFPDSGNWSLDYPVDQFNRVDIEIVATNIPGHFAKLQQIQIGQVIVFFQDELVRVTLLNEVDPSSCELSADELTVEIRDSKRSKLDIRKNHQLQLYRNDEMIASHFVRDSAREGESKITLKGHSAIAMLEDTFLGGFYDKESLPEILSAVLGDMPYVTEISLLSKTISGYLPACTKRAALQQIAFAAGAYVTTQGNGTIQINAVPDIFATAPVSGFGKDKVLSGSNLTQVAPPKKIQVTAHKYTEIEEIEELAEVSVPNKSPGRQEEIICTFSEPHWGYSYVQLTSEEGGTVYKIEEHANWVRIIADAGVALKLTGKKYGHTTLEHTWINPDISDFGGDTIKVENATLITEDNVENAIARLKDYHTLTSSLKGTVVVNHQKAGEIVEVANPYGSDLTVGYITSMESEFTANGHTASIEVKGTARPANEAEVLIR